MSRNFVCLRVTTMDDVDVNLFRFDYDNTLVQFFMNPQGHIYSRYGWRRNGDGDAVQSIRGILDAMQKALDLHKKEAARTPPPWKPVETQDLASFKADPRRPGGCLHCHHAGYYVRKEEFKSGRLSREMIWPYPTAENLGITLDVDKNTLVQSAAGDAEKAGIQAGDLIVSVDDKKVVTPADIQWVLNSYRQGSLKIGVERGGKPVTVTIPLKGDDWRKTDIAWRRSWWDSGPNIGLKGDDLSPDERKALGLPPTAIAIKVTSTKIKGAADAAGIKTDDVIVTVDGKSVNMEAIEFQMHLRLTRKIGDVVPIVVQRGKQRLAFNVKLK